MQKRISALDYLAGVVQLLNLKYVIAGMLPLLYYAPKITITVVFMIVSFGFGVMFQESFLCPQGTFMLVNKHFQERIGSLQIQSVSATNTKRDMIAVELTPELDSSINKLISFVIRDFVKRWWNPKFNHSGSTEFPDAIHESLYSVFLTLGHSLGKVNRADVILAVMQVVIEHIREYRKFDVTGMDIEDFLKEYPESKFHRFHTKENIIESLMDQSMRLSIHALPRSERTSGIVFGVCREILATTVLLPIMQKVTNPMWLNQQLLDRLCKHESDIEKDLDEEFEFETSEVAVEETLKKPQQILWVDYLESKLNSMKILLKEAIEKVESANVEKMQSAANRKLEIQRNIEELNEIISHQKDKNANQMLVPIDNISVSVRFNPLDPDEQGFSLSKAPPRYNLSLRTFSGFWKLEKDSTEIEAFYILLSSILPRAAIHAPDAIMNPKRTWSFAEDKINYENVALQIEIWLSEISVDPIAGLLNPVVQFFQPVDSSKRLKRNSRGIWETSNLNIEKSMQSALNTVGNTLQQLNASISQGNLKEAAKLDSEKMEKEIVELPLNSILTAQELEIILDVLFSAVEELFSDPDQWFRQQSLSLIKVFMRTLFGTRVSKSITTKLDKVSSQETISATINKLTDRLWPGGEEWGKTPNIVPTAHEADRVKHQLFILLGSSEEIPKNDEFKKAVKGINNLVGDRNTKQGLLRGFHLVQNQNLNMGLCVEVLEVLVKVITNPK